MNIIKYIKHPFSFFKDLKVKRLNGRYGQALSDEEYLRKMFKVKVGKALNLDNPQCFTEKLQWLKLYNRKPEYTIMVDKYTAKKYVAEKIGEEYIIPTYGIWDRFDDIDFDALPNQFVLKCTHDSGGRIICRDKEQLDLQRAKQKINASLARDYYLSGREWPYKDVPRKIIAEKYMKEESVESGEECLTDYKWFCFNGEPKLVYISKDNAADPRTDFFDMDFNHVNMRMKDKNSEVLPEKPKLFDEMKRLATILSAGIPHVRVDFYNINGRIYFGELTFFHNSGFSRIYPEEWDYTFGSWIKLPKEEV